MSAGALEILDGGLLTTVQDAGRPDTTHLGVPESGAADPWSRAVANLLVGNEPADAVLELTLDGGSMTALAPLTIGLAGADLGGRIRGGPRLAPARSHRLAACDVIAFPGV
jgi:allophanate hydrolase subunit 2